jgi:hypothetical protein
MCLRNLKCVLRHNTVYHRNLGRCNTKCGNLSKEFGIRAKTECSFSQNFERCNTKCGNMSEEFGIRAKTECS